MGETEGFHYTDTNFVPTLRKLNAANEIQVNADGILLETCQREDGALILHLLNAANEQTVEKLTVTLAKPVKTASCISLEKTEIADITENRIVLCNLQTTATLTIQ